MGRVARRGGEDREDPLHSAARGAPATSRKTARRRTWYARSRRERIIWESALPRDEVGPAPEASSPAQRKESYAHERATGQSPTQ